MRRYFSYFLCVSLLGVFAELQAQSDRDSIWKQDHDRIMYDRNRGLIRDSQACDALRVASANAYGPNPWQEYYALCAAVYARVEAGQMNIYDAQYALTRKQSEIQARMDQARSIANQQSAFQEQQRMNALRLAIEAQMNMLRSQTRRTVNCYTNYYGGVATTNCY